MLAFLWILNIVFAAFLIPFVGFWRGWRKGWELCLVLLSSCALGIIYILTK